MYAVKEAIHVSVTVNIKMEQSVCKITAFIFKLRLKRLVDLLAIDLRHRFLLHVNYFYIVL